MASRQTKFVLLISSLMVLAFAGCGKTTSSEEAALSNSLSYQAYDNGCDTGFHEFSTFAEFCAGLQDEKLNHLCAQSGRKKFFTARGCPGTFTPKY